MGAGSGEERRGSEALTTFGEEWAAALLTIGIGGMKRGGTASCNETA